MKATNLKLTQNSKYKKVKKENYETFQLREWILKEKKTTTTPEENNLIRKVSNYILQLHSAGAKFLIFEYKNI